MLLFCITFLLCSCDKDNVSREKEGSITTQRGEYISRQAREHLEIPAMDKVSLPIYPWKRRKVGGFPLITKEHFRCMGTSGNADKLIDQGGQSIYISDCDGIDDHSLPLRDGKEYIYPVLINLLNYVQAKVKKQVVVTSGHRCPVHNKFNNPSLKEQYSKHMIGAEVSFYVLGMEQQAEAVIACLQSYFLENPVYGGLADYTDFKRWEKNTDVTTPPWYNKEVFIKHYLPHEGRDVDNNHPYPYIAIQVRYDRSQNARVAYSWEHSFHNYWRW